MDTSIQLMRLDLDGRWTADELGQSLISLSDLYDLRLFLELLREDHGDLERFFEELMQLSAFRHRWNRLRSSPLPFLDEAQLARLSRLFEPEERLEVRRVSYASPGFTDLAGIGTVVGHVKDFILKLIERRDSRRQLELNEEHAALENDRIRIENSRNFVALCRDLGYADTELRLLAAYVDRKQEPLFQLIEQQKLRSVSTPHASTADTAE